MQLFTMTITPTVVTTTFAANDMPDLIAVVKIDPIVLVHRPMDLLGEDGSDSEEDVSETNAARRVGVLGAGSWGFVARMVGSVVVGGVVVLLQ